MTLNVTLAKKHIQTSRKAYSEVAEPSWRGMSVDHSTALPESVLSHNLNKLDARGCVAVTDVSTDSSAWAAGVRTGEFVSEVDGRRIRTPQEFFAAVADKPGLVTLTLTGMRSSRQLQVRP